METETITIHLFDDQRITVDVHNGSSVNSKELDYRTLLNCINKSLLAKGKLDSGILPPGIVSYGYEWEDEAPMSVFTMEYDQPCADIIYEETEFTEVPMPRLLFRFTIANSLVKSVNLCALCCGQPITGDMPVFYYPFSNIVPGTDWRVRLCTDLPIIDTPTRLQAVAGEILRLPNNDDTFNIEHLMTMTPLEPLITDLKEYGRKYYEQSLLLRIPDKTVQDFIKGE